MEDTEIWKEIEGYDGLYRISNFGRVQNCKGLIMKTFKKYKHLDYQQLVLSKSGVKRTHTLHVLVAKAFPEICGEWFEGCEVDHIDGNPANNTAKNLHLVSHKDNMQNPITKQRCHGHKNRKRSIIQLTVDGQYVRTWDRIKDAADFYGCYASTISMVLAGKYKHAHGFKWCYAS